MPVWTNPPPPPPFKPAVAGGKYKLSLVWTDLKRFLPIEINIRGTLKIEFLWLPECSKRLKGISGAISLFADHQMEGE